MNLSTRLSLMMFLQFFIWGAWYTTVAVFMSAHGMANLTHWPYTVAPVAAIGSPFFLGLIADRYFAAEKVLGWLHLMGGIVMLAVPQTVGIPVLFILLLLIYSLCYMPTLGLVNTLAFHHIDDREKQFPRIRVFGTIGWIVAGLFVSFVLGMFVGESIAEVTAWPIYTAGIAGILMGLYSFSLPHTPPQAAGEQVSVRSILGLDAFRQIGSRPFYIFLASTLLLCIPLAAYYNFTQIFLGATGFSNIAGTQTLGQMSEVILMLCMPFFFARLGIKHMLMIGMVAWVVRYLLFAAAATETVVPLILLGILLHGVCYDFFFVTAQIYMDKKATPAIRGQVQGFFVLIANGVGMLIGAQVTGRVYNTFLGQADALSLASWQTFWTLPAVFALMVLLMFAMTFKEKK